MRRPDVTNATIDVAEIWHCCDCDKYVVIDSQGNRTAYTHEEPEALGVVFMEPLGHTDEDGDGVCDYCRFPLAYYDCAHANTVPVGAEPSCVWRWLDLSGVPADDYDYYASCTFAYCPDCGIYIAYEYDGMPETTAWYLEEDGVVINEPALYFDDTIAANLTVVPAICSKDGSRTVKRSRCDKTVVTPIAAAGHQWGKWTVTKQAAADAKGEKARECGVCHEKQTGEIPATGAGENNNDNNNNNTGKCKWCGNDHSVNFWQKIVGFFHRILYFFAHLFGRK